MKLRHHDLHIPTEKGSDPFENCKLDRKKYADVLTDIVDGYADGFVLAINNPWGEGKTTFVKMWRQHLINEGFPTLYFNAWENDFQQDVLVALISELSELKNKPEQQFKDVLKKVVPLTGKMLPSIIKHLQKRYGGDDAAQDIAEAFGEYTEDQLKELTDSYKENKESIKKFRDSLEAFASEAGGDKPLVFIIDELDRCRPNYAVEVLEQIKHLFSVQGIVFVLSIDKEQLGNAVRGVYGSDRINAVEYLRRFIDLEYSIPRPNVQMYIEYLYEYFNFDEFLNSEDRTIHTVFKDDSNRIKVLSQLFFSKGSFSLRQIEKVFCKIRLTLKGFDYNHYIFPEIVILIAYLSVRHPNVLDKLRRGEYALQEVVDELENILLPLSDENNKRHLVNLLSSFLLRYSNEYLGGYGSKRGQLTVRPEDGVEHVLGFKSQFEDAQNNLLNMIQFYGRNHETSSSYLSFIVNRFDLIEQIKN